MSGSRRPYVCIDVRLIGTPGGGFTTYQCELVRGLAKVGDSLEWEPVFLAGTDGAGWIGETWKKWGRSTPRLEVVTTPFLHPREWWEIPRVLRRVGTELFHSTTFMSVPRPLMPCPWLVTIHDLNHLKYGTATQKLYYRGLLAPFARGARRIYTVSEFSRGEIADWLAFPRERIGLASNALEAGFGERIGGTELDARASARGLARGRYVISLSNPKPHKNLAALVAGYALYRRGTEPGRALDLVLTVPDDFSRLPGVKCLGALDVREARALVQASAGMVFPSLYEGFGLPPVEAIAQGVPVACSAIRPHREGLDGVPEAHVLWVPEAEARRPEAWAEVLARLDRAEERQEVLRPPLEVSRSLLDRFSSERLGATMAAAYSLALQGVRTEDSSR
jgi:glycosyltransferase involved in cell wall biosynthesis